jgi:phosphoribosylglycinamide formyltransferase-1
MSGGCPVVVLISGRGSNLAALLAAQRAGELGGSVVAVVSNRPDAAGLAFAAEHDIDSVVVDHKRSPDRDSFDQALIGQIDRYRPRLVVLAGFMRILTPRFVAHYAGRLLNIHPSLLPELRGLDTHRRALDEGHREHGASVHFVTEGLDEGPVILQASIAVASDDTPDSLAGKVLVLEHRIYPLAVRWCCEGRAVQTATGVEIDGVLSSTPPRYPFSQLDGG